jgi:thiol-disulfide isomerase/thioredoxin
MTTRITRFLILTLALALTMLGLAACSGDAMPQAEAATGPEPTGRTGGAVGDTAPKFTGIDAWLNSEPLTMEGLRGKVVLVDFWTYTCVNCIRTLPYLREWHAKYAAHGLVIVGVHTPEFAFEQVTSNVRRALDEFGLAYPVAQDNAYGTWRAFDNRYWPAKYLLGGDGLVRYTHFGEGDYDGTEAEIRAALTAAGADVSAVPMGTDPGPEIDEGALTGLPEDTLTRELYGGYDRNNSLFGIYIGHREYYSGPGRVVDYTDPELHRNGLFYLQGPWLNEEESLRHARTSAPGEDYVALRFLARSVNVVLEVPEDGAPYQVDVTLNGEPLTPRQAGGDIVFAGGRSYFNVDEGRLYEVVYLEEGFGWGELQLSPTSPDFTLFAFTFGAYEGVP